MKNLCDLVNQLCIIVRLKPCGTRVKNVKVLSCFTKIIIDFIPYNINNKTIEMIMRFKTTEYDITEIKHLNTLYFSTRTTQSVSAFSLSFLCHSRTI